MGKTLSLIFIAMSVLATLVPSTTGKLGGTVMDEVGGCVTITHELPNGDHTVEVGLPCGKNSQAGKKQSSRIPSSGGSTTRGTTATASTTNGVSVEVTDKECIDGTKCTETSRSANSGRAEGSAEAQVVTNSATGQASIAPAGSATPSSSSYPGGTDASTETSGGGRGDNGDEDSSSTGNISTDDSGSSGLAAANTQLIGTPTVDNNTASDSSNDATEARTFAQDGTISLEEPKAMSESDTTAAQPGSDEMEEGSGVARLSGCMPAGLLVLAALATAM